MARPGHLFLARGIITNDSAIRLNHGAAAHAASLIDAGKYDDTTPWSMSTEDEDKLLGANGDDWTTYRQYHLGESGGPTNEKGTYSYPYGKDGKVYGQALRAIRTRASQNGATEVFDEAGRLLDKMNAKTGTKNAALDRYYSMKNLANGEGEILLYSDIGAGGWFTEGTTAQDFSNDLKGLGPVKTINCRINSPGGEVFEGMTIYNLLAAHKARVVVHIDGLAASIASVIAMAGNEINIADNAMMMIHNAAGMCFGESKDMRKTADLLDNVGSTIAGTYAKRSGTDLDKITQMMADETWMDAKQAKECGLVDNIVDNMQAMACAFDPKRFRNTPEKIVKSISAMSGRERFADKFKGLHVPKYTRS